MAEQSGRLLSVVQQNACTIENAVGVSTPNDLRIVTDKPKFPQYAIVSKRTESFDKWPEYLPVSIKDLVEAGLVFTGVGDSVRCYYCGGGLRNWEEGDVPMEEHAKWYPKCPHVLLAMGPDYVERVGRGEKPDLEMDCAVPQSQETINEDDLMDTIAVKSCLEMDFSKELVRSAVRLFIVRHGHHSCKAEDIAQLCFDIEEEPSLIETLNRNSNNTEVRNNVACTLHSEYSAENEESLEKLLEENQRLKDEHICKICLDNAADVIFLPCRHMPCCPQCAPAMSKCPICRTDIEGLVKAVISWLKRF